MRCYCDVVLRAVIDTNVVLQGLTLRGDSGRIMEAWRDRRFVPCVSTALALEYEEVLLRSFPPARAHDVQAALQALLARAEYVPIRFRLRPASPDPDDDFALECAFNAQAVLVSGNDKDLRGPCGALHIDYASPLAFLSRLFPTE